MEQKTADQETPAAHGGDVQTFNSLAAKKVSDCKSLLQPHCDVAVLHKHQQVAGSSEKVEKSLTHVSLTPCSTAELTTREDFLQYARQLSLEPNTAHRHLALSEGNRRATVMEEEQSSPDHDDRFIYYGQVLSRESLTGRCYWELEWDAHWVYIAVSYRDLDRDGSESGFGFNDKSWAVDCGQNSVSFWAHRVETEVSGRVGSRIGVFLDHSAGVLSFYSVSETMSLIHRVHTTFTQPLFAGLCFNWYKAGDTAYFPPLQQ